MKRLARSSRLVTPHVASAVAALFASGTAWAAPPPLPNYLGNGFVLETLDPSPAGDRFVVAPDASVVRSIAASALVDTLYRPVDVQLAGHTAMSESHALYLHAGLSVAPCEWFELSGDLPFALDHTLVVNAPYSGLPKGDLAPPPQTGDVGDSRIGVRVAVLPEETRKKLFDLAFAEDVWLTSGNAITLTGQPRNRLRTLAILSGRWKLSGDFAIDYAASTGFQTYLPGASDTDGAAIPARLASAVDFTTHQKVVTHLRLSLEYFGAIPVGSEGVVPRGTDELVASYAVTLGCDWTLGVGEGFGLSSAPGVPYQRWVFTVQTRDFFRGCPK